MITKLDKIEPGFRRFSRSQFLTDSHLNQIFDHFDDQIRLSRVNLSGVGIVCGFEISSTFGVITINQGLGITTDGDLLHLYKDIKGNKTIDFPSIDYRYFKIYDNSKSNYFPFFFHNEAQIELYELLTTDEDSETSSLINFSNDGRPALEDMVVLIYIENYERNINQCSSLNCDGEGIDVVANYRVLLTTKANAALINSHDSTINRINYHKLYYQLPEVLLPKVIVELEDFEDFNTLIDKLTSPFSNTKVLDDLLIGYKTIFETLKLSDLGTEFENRITTLFDPDSGQLRRPDIQYRYDLLKDIVNTYQEIKRIMLKLSSRICYANLSDFPKHLMLGELVNEKNCYDCRHGFYKSVAHTAKAGKGCFNCDDANSNGDGGLTVCYDIHEPEQKLFSLLLRTLKQLEGYNLVFGEVKITPSRLLGDLSQKAIPFYYKVDEELIKLWNFDKSAKKIEKSNVSYHRDLLDSDNPLTLCVDKDFYRIEGHLGQDYKHVIEELKNLKTQNAVSFNIVALRISNPIGLIGGEVRREAEGTVATRLTELRELAEDYTSYYVSRRPGLEHKAGVTPKGTFVLVFLDDIAVLPGGGEGEGGLSRRRELSSPAVRMELATNPVIADFMVPYVCCDESVLKLELPVSTLCFGSDTEPIPFKASPTNGFVTADIPRGLNGGVIRDDKGDSYFDPNMVSPELINTPIRFELNNQDTEAVITINRLPEPIVSTAVVYDNPFRTEVTVTYTVSGLFLNEIEEFEWDFLGDDTFVNDEPKASGNVVRQYQNSVESAPNTIIPKLRVRSRFCENEISIDPITFEDPIVIELDFDRNKLCVNPADCDISIHIALTVDESGSIREEEIPKIKNGLTTFVNDQEGSNNFISLINMNDTIGQDEPPSRIIPETKITTSNKELFLQWIAEYRTTGNVVPSGAASWANALNYINTGLNTIPDIVIVIANGSVGDFDILRNKIQQLRAKTHIFYYCLSEGSYVTPGNTSENLVPSLTQLLNRTPVLSQPDFSDIDKTDYFSFTNFGQLGNFLNNLKQILDTAIGCIETVNITALQPADGLVATVGNTPYSGLQIQDRIIINPKEFTAFGESIEFTVDGFDTDETLLVERAPVNVNFEATTITYNDDKTEATVTFQFKGQFLPDSPKIEWDFGDGRPTQQGTSFIQQYTYTNLSILKDRTAIVNATIDNQVCMIISETVRVVFDKVKEVFLSIVSSLCLDGSEDTGISIPFSVIPADGKVSAVRRMNGMRIGTNEITFIPTNFVNYDIPIAFTVDDQPVMVTITVAKKPSLTIVAKIAPIPIGDEDIDATKGDVLGSEGNFIERELYVFNIENLNQFNEEKFTYLWSFGDNDTSTEKTPTHLYRYRNNVTVEVILKVSDGICDAEIKQKINLSISA
ncbi:PKD domain-containing protein [Aquimarina sp. ERC-38]|uniref:hypothetical protein n=1 Tax=Aquimarina sp. ERC-38 TaxID=2949996 RepID=UPI0022481BC7|nr:hypothetical protein [Aquimarina sp. ERC-38]UZO81749.1 PKD domain-containing protein [Aquimarina sp. ERC-38]